jgi:DNA-binding MarR family transcriptional regulator
MNKDKMLAFTDHMGQYNAQRHGLPPVMGRVIAYLSVCEPIEQSINDIADALLTSRSAVNNALKLLESQKLVQRSRPAGTRADVVRLNPISPEHGFDPEEYRELSALAREGLELLEGASPERRQALEAMASLGDFLAERLPQLYEEWHQHYQNVQIEKNK